LSRIIIGTAGHIDHGKTALVKALTGVETDRLKEEQARGITIELGFALLELPGGFQAAIIDVPGHERFIKNMLAGAAGIDLALLIIAANEGVMPQTREHFDILRLLEIRAVIVVITKIDLVDEEYLALVQEDIQELLRGTPFHNAPLAEVSAKTGQGMEKLLQLIGSEVRKLPGRRIREGLSRLPIDRVFTVQGIGTVVTGTLFDGVIKRGDILEVPGRQAQIKVRGLQVHGQTEQEAWAGQRVALNLTGPALESIERGDVLLSPGWSWLSNRIDLSVKLLPSSPFELADMLRVRFHHGTKESIGRIFVLGKERILPGEDGFVQLVCEEPLHVLRGDNYILRSYSPLHTIGGGRVIEPLASKHKKNQPRLVEELVIKAEGQVPQLSALLLGQSPGIVSMGDLAKRLGLPARETQEQLIPLLADGIITEIKAAEGDSGYLDSARLQAWEKNIAREIQAHVPQFPLSPGTNKETARPCRVSNLTVRDYNILLQLMEGRQALRVIDNQFLQPYEFNLQIPSQLAEKISELKKRYTDAAWQVPDLKALAGQVGVKDSESKQLLMFMLRERTLIQLTEDLYLPATLLLETQNSLKEWFAANASLSVAQFRDLVGTTRRVAVPLLEYLDSLKITKRQGDQRTAGPALFDSGGAA